MTPSENKQCSIPETKKAIPCRGVEANTDMWIKQMSKRDSQLWGMERPLWVIDNKIYNLQQFASKHPGGKSWIELTRGQDITALFKTHHLEEEKTLKIAQKYYVGEANIKHESRFNFQGHFNKIRARILQKFTVAELQNSKDTEIVCWTISAVIVLLMALAGYLHSYTISIICGSLMMNFYGIGHLFIHRKDGHPLRHAFLLIGFSAKQQQIMHAISHHPYSNTLLDYEYAGLEPIMNFARCLPKNKWFSLLIVEVLFILVGPINVLTKIIVVPIIKKERVSLEHIVFLLQIGYIYLFAGDFWVSVKLWAVIVLVYGLFFGKMVLCPHRQIQLWSQGAPQIKDFVLHMIATTTDTNHEKISPYLSLILYSGFNIHVLHHLFPTVDHSKLYECNKIFTDYCKEAGMKVMTSKSMFQCNKNMYCLQVGRRQFDINLFLKE